MVVKNAAKVESYKNHVLTGPLCCRTEKHKVETFYGIQYNSSTCKKNLTEITITRQIAVDGA